MWVSLASRRIDRSIQAQYLSGITWLFLDEGIKLRVPGLFNAEIFLQSMDRERLVRRLSAILVPLGVVLLVLGGLLGDYFYIATGSLTAIMGAIIFWTAGRYWTQEVDVTKTSPFVLSLVGLGNILLVFAIITYLVSDVESVTRAVYTGTPFQRPLTYLGILLGLFFGGGVPYLVTRWDSFERLSESVPGRLVGLSLTVGTYVLLLVSQPVASVIYASAYLVSRLGMLLGIYAQPRL